MAIRGTTRHLDAATDAELGWSAVVRANGFLLLAGISAVDDTQESPAAVGVGDPVAQINYIYDMMEKVLALCGATLEHVVQEKVFMTVDVSKMHDAFEARKRRYAPYALPATAGCQVVALDTPGTMLEVMATAIDPETL